jgi:hypothetical protein
MESRAALPHATRFQPNRCVEYCQIRGDEEPHRCRFVVTNVLSFGTQKGETRAARPNPSSRKRVPIGW